MDRYARLCKHKTVPLVILAFLTVAICLSGCSTKRLFEELSQTASIEIRAFSMTDQTYTDHTVTDAAAVRRICDAFSSLELKKVKITEPLEVSYEICFLYPSRLAIQSVAVIAGENVIDCDGTLYKITNGVEIGALVAEIVGV